MTAPDPRNAPATKRRRRWSPTSWRCSSSVVASQDDLHQRFGGVVPEIASRAHVERILPVIDEALAAGRI